MPLVLTRGLGEKILVGDDIIVKIVRIGPKSVRVMVDAPGKRIVRSEIADSRDERPQTDRTESD